MYSMRTIIYFMTYVKGNHQSLSRTKSAPIRSQVTLKPPPNLGKFDILSDIYSIFQYQNSKSWIHVFPGFN